MKSGQILVEQDSTVLEGRLAQRQRELLGMQAEKREAAVGARQGTREIDQPEVEAAREILDLQAEITTATTVAPADGYVVRQLYAVGAKARRRKPLLVFVEAEKTLLEISIPASDAAPFTAGSKVLVSSTDGRGLSFSGTVLATKPSPSIVDQIDLSVQPLELPFLALDRPALVGITTTR